MSQQQPAATQKNDQNIFYDFARVCSTRQTWPLPLSGGHLWSLIMPRPHRAEALSDGFVWRLSVLYIKPNSRTERPRKTKIGTEVAHITHDSDTTFRSSSPGRFGWLYDHANNGDLSGYPWRISCHHLQAWAEAYRGGRPPTACIVQYSCSKICTWKQQQNNRNVTSAKLPYDRIP